MCCYKFSLTFMEYLVFVFMGPINNCLHLFMLCKKMHCQKLLYKLFAFTELEEQQKMRDEATRLDSAWLRKQQEFYGLRFEIGYLMRCLFIC